MKASVMEAMIVFRDWFHQPTMESEPQLAQQLSDLRARIATRFPRSITYEFLPFGFVSASLEELRGLAAEPGVQVVFEPSAGWKRYRPTYMKVLRALNALRSETGHQVFEWPLHVGDGRTLPHEKFQGGWWPPRAGYPRLRDGASGRVEADDSLVTGASPAWMPVINLSIAPPRDVKYEVNDPVAFALAGAARTHLLVVAAGNDGPAPASLNPWAVGDAVLSVGATEDEEGSRLAARSSRGSADGQLPGPDVVAWWRAPSGARGTSFAAPRVAMMAAFCSALLAQVHHAWLLARDATHLGVPLMGWGMVDSSEERLDLPERLDTPALPIAGVRWDAMIQALREEDIRVSLQPWLLKKIILDAARPMTRYTKSEVGAGFVREELLLEHLATTTVGDVIQWFRPEVHVRRAIAQEPAFAVDELQALAQVVRQTAPTWLWDLASETFIVNGRVSPRQGSDFRSMIAGSRELRRVLGGHSFEVADTARAG